MSEKAIRAAIRTRHLKAKRQSTNSNGEGLGTSLILLPDLQAWLEGLPDA